MTRILQVILVAIGLFAQAGLLTSRGLAAELAMHTEVLPPLQWRDGDRSQGPTIELISLAAQRAGVDIRIDFLPWSRGFGMARDLPDNCIFVLGQTGERRPQFLWAGPIATGGVGLYALREVDPNLTIAAINDGGLIVGVKTLAATETVVRGAGIHHIFSTTEDQQLLAMLKAGRFDLWAGGRLTAAYRLSATGLTLAREVMVLDVIDVYVGCNLASDRTAVGALDREMKAMNASGERDDIFRRWGAAYLTLRH